jgi:hypothetical protein
MKECPSWNIPGIFEVGVLVTLTGRLWRYKKLYAPFHSNDTNRRSKCRTIVVMRHSNDRRGMNQRHLYDLESDNQVKTEICIRNVGCLVGGDPPSDRMRSDVCTADSLTL